MRSISRFISLHCQYLTILSNFAILFQVTHFEGSRKAMRFLFSVTCKYWMVIVFLWEDFSFNKTPNLDFVESLEIPKVATCSLCFARGLMRMRHPPNFETTVPFHGLLSCENGYHTYEDRHDRAV